MMEMSGSKERQREVDGLAQKGSIKCDHHYNFLFFFVFIVLFSQFLLSAETRENGKESIIN